MSDMTDLLMDLNSTEYETVIKAISELGDSKDPKAIPVLKEQARSKIYLEAAVRALRKFGDEHALEALVSVMDIYDPEMCAGYEIVMMEDILLGLYKELEMDPVPTLIDLLSAPHEEARRKAAVIVSEFDDEKVLPALKAALENEENSTNQIVLRNIIEKLES